MLPDTNEPRLRKQIMMVGIPGNDQIGDFMDELLAAISKQLQQAAQAGRPVIMHDRTSAGAQIPVRRAGIG